MDRQDRDPEGGPERLQLKPHQDEKCLAADGFALLEVAVCQDLVPRSLSFLTYGLEVGPEASNFVFCEPTSESIAAVEAAR